MFYPAAANSTSGNINGSETGPRRSPPQFERRRSAMLHAGHAWSSAISAKQKNRQITWVSIKTTITINGTPISHSRIGTVASICH
jgi:hypothetical protein